MPYVTSATKDDLEFDPGGSDTPGELNYSITKLLVWYWNSKGHSYQTINDVMGAVEGAKMEFYRRVAVPYEDQKCFDNGDVYV